MRIAVFLLLGTSAALAEDATAIMVRVAANVEKAVDARRQYVYHQTVRASLARTNGQLARREKRQYLVLPSATTEKKLVYFQGEYRKGKQSVTYQEPVKDNQNEGIDAELLQHLTEELVNDRTARDGIPHNLFPLRSVDLPKYVFTLKGELQHQGRRTYRIAFEPSKKVKEICDHPGKGEDNDCVDSPWMGEAWIDATELEPVRIDTHLALKVPWAVRTLLGTNLKQTGFAITYQRVADGVWFPAAYGTEFQVDVLFFYKRTIAMNLESSGFQRTDATSKIEYNLVGEASPRWVDSPPQRGATIWRIIAVSFTTTIDALVVEVNSSSLVDTGSSSGWSLDSGLNKGPFAQGGGINLAYHNWEREAMKPATFMLAGLIFAWMGIAQDLPPGVLPLSQVRTQINEELHLLTTISWLETVQREHQAAKGKMRPLDAIRLEVLRNVDKGLFASPDDQRFSEDHPMSDAGSGTLGNGLFGPYLKDILISGSVASQYKGEEEVGGRLRARYDYQIPPLISG